VARKDQGKTRPVNTSFSSSRSSASAGVCPCTRRSSRCSRASTCTSFLVLFDVNQRAQPFRSAKWSGRIRGVRAVKLFGFFTRVKRRTDLLDRMMATLGVRGKFASLPNGPEVLRRAATRCMTCGRADACAAWLDEDRNRIEAPGFCRNHDLFERLKHRIEADRLRSGRRTSSLPGWSR